LSDPIGRFRAQLEEARAQGVIMPIAMALATADAEGRPSLRMVLLRGVDERGFVFFTHGTSRKGRELEARPQAALCFWWPPLEEQVRIEGEVERVTEAEADAYWESRPRGSRLAAAASPQSAPMPSREAYQEAVEELAARYPDAVPRPPEWTGFRVVAERIEFWYGRENRMHERELFTRSDTGWVRSLLYP
jgi:pyridoxamine 5'-phosphate oxidase